MGEASTVFGLIHDLQDRKRQRRVRDLRRNYLSDPLETIQQVHEVDPDMGLALRDDYTQTLQQRQQGEQAAATAERERALGAARNLTQGLIRVRDNQGDVATAFDQSAPILQQGFGMAPEEIAEWRTRITSDPTTLDNLNRMLNEPPADENRLYDLAPGARLFDRTGRQIAESPALPKTVTVKRADGGTDVLVMDEQGNFVQSGQAGGVPSAIASVPGRLVLDPQARGMRNMNPGNIKDGPWARRQPGYAGSDGTFARFNSIDAGQAAQERLLGQNYVNGQRNLTQIVDKYLGFTGAGGENSQASRDNYIRYVAGQTGLDPSAPVPQSALPQMAQAMREFENGGGPATGGSGSAPRPAYSTPGAAPEPPDGFRWMTEAEKTAQGLDPNRSYQVGMGGDNEGMVREVPGQPRPRPVKPGRTNGTSEVTTAVSAASRMRDAARRIRTHPSFDQATGSIQGALPSLFQGSREFDDDLQAFRDRVVIETIAALKKASETGATGFGQLTEKEGSRLENSMGSLRQTSPENLSRTLDSLERDAMISIGTLYNIPPEATMMLLQNPNLTRQFDEKYGQGRAAEILGNRR